MSNTQHAPSPAPITSPTGTPKVGIIMGSQSDWATMSLSAQILADFGIPFECQVVSAHRTPDKLFDYAKTAKDKGLKVIIAGAGGAAHLPGMCGDAGAFNAGLLAIQILAIDDDALATKLNQFRQKQTQTVLKSPHPGIVNA